MASYHMRKSQTASARPPRDALLSKLPASSSVMRTSAKSRSNEASHFVVAGENGTEGDEYYWLIQG